MLLGAPGIATRSKDATRGSWHRYLEQGRSWGLLASLLGARTLQGAPGIAIWSKDAPPGIATRSKDATRGSWHRY